MEDETRVKFDIAWAIAIAQGQPQFLNSFPDRLSLADSLEKLLADCVDFGASGDSPRLKEHIPDGYQVFVGDDPLRLAPRGQIFVGGSGVTIQLFDDKLHRSYALKVPRVSVLAYQHPDFQVLDKKNWETRLANENRAFNNERQIARSLSHENIARHLYGHHKGLPQNAGVLPYSVSEWIDGATPLHKYLWDKRDSLTALEVVSLVLQSFAALSHLHTRKVVHWDIKSDNVLVASDGTLKLIDFGNAKLLDVRRSEDDLVATTTEGKYPEIPALEVVKTDQNESRRYRIRMPDFSWNHPAVDLWMMAQEWNRNLSISPSFRSGKSDLSDAQQSDLHRRLFLSGAKRSADILEGLRLILERALFPFNPKYVAGFSCEDKFNPDGLYYENAEDVVSELARIQPTFGAAQAVPELLVSLDDIVRLPVTGNAVFTDRVASVADSKIVRPTKRHFQLGQVREVFPGASHMRYEHLLGTVSTAAYFVRSLYLNEMNAFWRISATEIDVSAVLLASILHDVGHLAFGHFVEELGDLVAGAKHSNYVVELLNRCVRRLKGSDENDPPRPPGPFIFLNDEIEELCRVVLNHWVKSEEDDNREAAAIAFLARVKAIFEAQVKLEPGPCHLSRASTAIAMNGILKSIIDGPIDADKLDYLRRDALHAGVYFSSGIDLERFFESVRACVGTRIDATHTWPAIGVSEKGIAPVETIVTARYHLYSVVYWHRTVRCITAMLQRVISETRLATDDGQWSKFFAAFLDTFRRQDDQQALEWLNEALGPKKGKLKLIKRPISSRRIAGTRERVTLGDLMDALQGNRAKYFHMAYELSYLGPVGAAAQQGKQPRERLHDVVCAKAHPKVKDGESARVQIRTFREALENAFSELLLDQKTDFEVDTILLDVPEPDKDQLKGLFVDRRSKRLRRTRPLPDGVQSDGDFSELSDVSPIAASLSNVFRLWARKVRIYMTQSDMRLLERQGYSTGDVAALWEKALFIVTKVDPSPQLSFRDID